MIKVTVELWPHGDELTKRTIATADIINDGTGTNTVGNYRYRLRGKNGRQLKEGELKGFKRIFNVWYLIGLVCVRAFFE